jgi:DNA (cytosine-5)-methyltransferase 1
MTHRYTCVDSFCGAGGLALGLERAGFKVLVSFDADACAVETFRANHASKCLNSKAEKVSGAELLAEAGCAGQLDLFAGGPPCQGFSKQKRGAHLGDERNSLVFEFARLVREMLPRFFLLENVDQLGGKRGTHFIDRIDNELGDYELYPGFYNSADYGLAQTRVRFIIVGKNRRVKTPFRIPRPTAQQWTTVGEALAGLPEPPLDYSEHLDFPNHYRAKVTPINIHRFSFVPQGGGWWDIPDELRLKCHQRVDRSSGGWPDVYGRLRLDGQAPTITAGFDSFTRGRYGHPLQDRPLTPREAARLQGFPDEFRFYGTRWDVRRQIGNAVPPPLSQAIAQGILKTLLIEDGAIEASEDDLRFIVGAGRQTPFNFADDPANPSGVL